MYDPILLPEWVEMLAENDEQGVAAFLEELHPASIADFSESLCVEENGHVLEHANTSRQAEIFS